MAPEAGIIAAKVARVGITATKVTEIVMCELRASNIKITGTWLTTIRDCVRDVY